MQGRQFQGLFGHRRILWQSRWGFYCLALNELCPIEAVLSVDDNRAYPMITETSGIRFFSLERKAGRRLPGLESVIEEVAPAVAGDIAELLDGSPGNWIAASTNASPALRQVAARLGIPYVGPQPELCHWLNDKTNFLPALPQIGLPRLSGQWLRLQDANYAELQTQFGKSFVAQMTRGVSGSGTHFIGCAEDYAQVGSERGDALMWVARDVGDLSLNINALATEEGTAVGYPSVQLAGVPELCRKRGQYCGNDYAATASLAAKIVNQVVEQTARIGAWLTSLGHRGLFGLDFVVERESDQAFAVDLNPRWQGSTWLLGQAQYGLGRFPLPVAELAYKMGVLSAAEVLQQADEFLLPVQVSQFSLHNFETQWSVVGNELEPGIYSFSRGFTDPRRTLQVRELDEDDFLLVAVPQRGLNVAPEGHIVRGCSRGAIYDAGQERLFAQPASMLRQLYLALGLEPGRAPNFGH